MLFVKNQDSPKISHKFIFIYYFTEKEFEESADIRLNTIQLQCFVY